jgi:hypothetical protein
MDRQEGGCEGMDWMNLAQDRDRWRVLVNVINGNTVCFIQVAGSTVLYCVHCCNELQDEQ